MMRLKGKGSRVVLGRWGRLRHHARAYFRLSPSRSTTSSNPSVIVSSTWVPMFKPLRARSGSKTLLCHHMLSFHETHTLVVDQLFDFGVAPDIFATMPKRTPLVPTVNISEIVLILVLQRCNGSFDHQSNQRQGYLSSSQHGRLSSIVVYWCNLH
jgi:hypothetical protein